VTAATPPPGDGKLSRCCIGLEWTRGVCGDECPAAPSEPPAEAQQDDERACAVCGSFGRHSYHCTALASRPSCSAGAGVMTTVEKPLLLLDVDGVLNGLVMKLPAGWETGMFNGYRICWDPSVVSRLRALHDEGRVEIQWLTTWCEDADRLLAEPMGLPRGLVTHSEHRTERLPGWWKLHHAREIAESDPDRRIVWIDDDHGPYDREAHGWVQAHPNVLAVRPDFRTGLTHAELDAMEAWL